ncbi:MAG: Asp-tRNA(Asn)/Glu-tRNA(Gln) amidotransferase subunit GatC [Alphaproteobacteria bacterium]|jgi:aspartyl-tRNA(Asn)/glutamyl-tRNA(Gln) amidotransferase subunit C|nr:Asp-tRNA(Asn)/Glu-tRNA(Gln) amidotransferase subunit GatC [Alphaproteobacteria bacterium]
MSVDKATVRRIAHLARIGVEEAELEGLEGELNNILAWVEQLGELDTQAVEPMASVHDTHMTGRADTVDDGGSADAIVANAPERHDHFFAVPKVVE